MASQLVLNVADRIDWKACMQPFDVEDAQTKQFRHDFKPFDFNMK